MSAWNLVGLLEQWLRGLLEAYVYGSFSLYGISHGHVELDGLTLKPEVIPASLPVTLRAGRIGRVKLEVPLFQILSRPIRVTLTDVTLILGLAPTAETPEEVLAEAAHQARDALREALACRPASTRRVSHALNTVHKQPV